MAFQSRRKPLRHVSTRSNEPVQPPRNENDRGAYTTGSITLDGLFRWWSAVSIVVVNHATTTFRTEYHDLRRQNEW